MSGGEDEDELEPPVPAGLGSLTAAQRALADFLRLDPDLLQVAAESSPGLPEVGDDARALATHIARLPVSDKDRLLTLVAADRAARARMELLRDLRGDPDEQRSSGPAGPSPNSSTRPRPAVCSTNSMRRSWPAARQALREHQPAAARQRDLDGLAQDPETAWPTPKG